MVSTTAEEDERCLRVVGLNLLHGGGPRVRALADAVIALEPDVAVLPEFRPGSPRAGELMAVFNAAGFAHQRWTTPQDPLVANGVAIVSKVPFDTVNLPFQGSPNGQRVLEVQVTGVDVVGVYFPNRAPKVRFWREEFLPWARLRLASPTVVIGDWNSGSHHVDEAGATLQGAAEFEAMTAMGWTDAWRSRHPDGREFTWYSPGWWNGFRLDHAFLAPSLAPRLLDARYEHGTRPDRPGLAARVSDHSAIVVDLAREPALGGRATE